MSSQGKHFPRCFGYSFKVGRYTDRYIEENIARLTDVCNKQTVQIKSTKKEGTNPRIIDSKNNSHLK